MECNEWPVSDKIVVTDTLDRREAERLDKYIVHALCAEGSATFRFNGSDFVLGKGDLLIQRRWNLVEEFKSSEDFKVKVIYIRSDFVTTATPLTNYGMKGTIALFINPVMHLTDCQYRVCEEDFTNVIRRHQATCYRFYDEGLRCAVQLMILDFFDFHVRLYSESALTPQFASIISRFFEMLDRGEYRRHREVTYYASELCISAKYLSEVCKKVSGHSANFWINRYTSLDISRLLRNRDLTFVQIADLFHFSSPAYFSRYVQNNLGMSPTEYRN